MGFFSKIKQSLGLGGVKVNLIVDPRIQKTATKVNGKVELSTKSPLHLLNLEVKLIEEYSIGKGDDEKTEIYELGTYNIDLNREIKPNEPQVVEFEFPFAFIKSNNDQLKEMGGAIGKLGKIGSYVSNEKSVYYIEADMDVKGVALDPSDKKTVQFV